MFVKVIRKDGETVFECARYVRTWYEDGEGFTLEMEPGGYCYGIDTGEGGDVEAVFAMSDAGQTIDRLFRKGE